MKKKELLASAPWRGDDENSDKFEDAKLKVTNNPGSTPVMHVPRKRSDNSKADDEGSAIEIDPELRYSFQRNSQDQGGHSSVTAKVGGGQRRSEAAGGARFRRSASIYNQKRPLQMMFSSQEWLSSTCANDGKGKKIAATILSQSYWNRMILALKIAFPLVKVLRLPDSEKKPSMSYMYKAIEMAKHNIRESLDNDESKFREAINIVDKRWECQLRRPLHAAEYFLNPGTFYDDEDIPLDIDVMNGVYACVEKLVPPEDQKLVLSQIPKYKAASGLFGNDFAINMRKELAPAEWWSCYGASTPQLAKLAIRVLSLTCSACGCERNWSAFEQIHTKKRNRLETQRLNDLVFVKYNTILEERFKMGDKLDPISLVDLLEDSNGWMTGTTLEDEESEAVDIDTPIRTRGNMGVGRVAPTPIPPSTAVLEDDETWLDERRCEGHVVVADLPAATILVNQAVRTPDAVERETNDLEMDHAGEGQLLVQGQVHQIEASSLSPGTGGE